ncbi:MAG: glycerate kinase, partial [Nitriliruptoraceae bacterium]
DIPLDAAAAMFGPQKGADAEAVADLDRSIRRWADVAERDLAGGAGVRATAGAGAAGGLAFGLACGIGAHISAGAAAVAELVGLDAALATADAVVTGEGQIDATSLHGKVVGEIRDRAMAGGLAFGAVVGRAATDAPEVERLAVASPNGPGADPFGAVAAAARRLADQW